MADPVTAAVAVGWGLKVAGWIASPVISDLFKKCSSFLGFDASKKLKELETRLLLLERVTEAVEESLYRPRLEQLFRDLKSAFYEAEDILDVLQYQRLQRQIQDNTTKPDGEAPPPGSKTADWVKKKLQCCMPASPFRNQESGMSKKQLKKSLEKIERVINDAYQILEQLNLPSVSNGRQVFTSNSRPAVTTAAPPLEVFGRDEERDKIIAMLHKQNNNSYLCHSVLGIYGIAGSGKSTLAQFVYARVKKDIQENNASHFDLAMWIYVSGKLDLDSILRELMEGATGNACPRFNSRNILQQNLEEKLHTKRIFLVLDDVWYNSRDVRDQEELQQILSLLNLRETGSKILVTSRSRDALVALGAAEERCIPISNLDDNSFLKMFMHYARLDAVIDGGYREKLEMIGAEIVKKLKRSPLAARTVGAQLCLRPNVEFWKATKNKDILNDTMGALWWSYQHLDEQVKRCFAYCSIYPRRHYFKRKELVQLWMAEGFIKTASAEEELDDIGQYYFDQLISSSFMQLGERKVEHGCNVDYFVVHDLLRDLAEEVSRADCFRIEEGFTGEIPLDVRHLFIGNCDTNMIDKILELQNLRTLIFSCPIIPHDYSLYQLIFKKLQKLRVLILKFSRHAHHTFSVPACVGQLKHLRYLYLDASLRSMLILPGSITELYHIQVLDVSHFNQVCFSGGKNMNQLVNLRCVSSRVDMDIPHIGKLKWLQMLPFFNVMKKHGYEIWQLKNLNKLEGSLQIRKLENVETKEEAVEASLADKERLTELELKWTDSVGCSRQVDAEVLEGLCPPKDLEILHIRYYQGSTYPNWMVGKKNGGPMNLFNLWLEGCTQLEPVPQLFEVFVNLRWFRLWYSDWHALPDNIELLKSLQVLDINGCFNIRSLPALPQFLERFYLRKCNEEFMMSCKIIDHPNWQKIQHVPQKYIAHG